MDRNPDRTVVGMLAGNAGWADSNDVGRSGYQAEAGGARRSPLGSVAGLESVGWSESVGGVARFGSSANIDGRASGDRRSLTTAVRRCFPRARLWDFVMERGRINIYN